MFHRPCRHRGSAGDSACLAGSTLGDSHGAVATGHGHCNDEELVPWRQPVPGRCAVQRTFLPVSSGQMGSHKMLGFSWVGD